MLRFIPALLLATALGISPAMAGLLGRSVALNGITTTIGGGIEFAGTDFWTGRPYTVDFGDRTLNIVLTNPTPSVPGGAIVFFAGTTFRFSFAEPIIASVVFSGGTQVTTPIAPEPPSTLCSSLPPGTTAACFTNVLPPTQSTLAFTPTAIDLDLISGAVSGGFTTANFSITTVPEPATTAVLGAGLLGLGLVRPGRSGRMLGR